MANLPVEFQSTIIIADEKHTFQLNVVVLSITDVVLVYTNSQYVPMVTIIIITSTM